MQEGKADKGQQKLPKNNPNEMPVPEQAQKN